MKLINADEAIKRLGDAHFKNYGNAIMVIKETPTVDAQPVRHGQWDYVTVVDEGFWRCSICGTPSEALGAKKLYKYCPFCGAKMDGEQDGD